MAERNPFTTYVDHLQAATTDALTDPKTLTTRTPGSRAAFLDMAHGLYARVITTSNDRLHSRLQTEEVKFGMGVIALFALQVARQARAQGRQDPEQIRGMLANPQSFANTLGPIASQYNTVAELLETAYGISPYADTSPRAGTYQFNQGVISLQHLDTLTDTYTDMYPPPDSADHKCAAHRAGQLQRIYETALPAYFHPRLVPAVLGAAALA
ncbi:MAG TPA: hypothetical protein VLF69_06315 [Candidatus Saccharimonadales bacterium]|nr:hypothetical protein [Candidatus Saccharimonadales bacterium]